MTSMTVKNNIKILLSRFETLVRISSYNNEYDIHNHAETVLIPLLNSVYAWNLENANFEDKNAVSIDLIDRKKRIGVQVTSDTSLKKIKVTIQKFLVSKYKNDIDTLYFYFLVAKQRSYSSRTLPKAAKNNLGFTFKKHLIDNDTLYSRIKSITSTKKLKEVEQLLKSEFAEVDLTRDVSMKQYESFKELYKIACLTNYSRLNFFGLNVSNKPREVELYSLFVQPTFKIDTEKNDSVYDYIQYDSSSTENSVEHVRPKLVSGLEKDEAYEVWTTQNFYYLNYRLAFGDLFQRKNIVLLGSPGAGKSSLIKFSICKILQQDVKTFKDKDIFGYIPYRVELHKYNLFKKNRQGGFHEYIKQNLADEFQIDTSNSAYRAIVEKFPTIIFFDGLDEIFDIHERVDVRNDIENFTKQNIKVKSVVTSRFESYSEVAFHRPLFSVLRVNDFDDQQIEEYVEKWYALEEESEKLRKKEIRSCLNLLKGVDNQLKHNPLLLSLILILYRNEQDLPTSKLEIYEGCAQTLVETRDRREKRLEFNLRVPHKVSVFSNLAYWQFSNETNDTGIKINHSSIQEFFSDYLLKKGLFNDRNDAIDAAKEFLEYAKLRSVYFENKFTHKTFYEYFVSQYIYSNLFSTPGRYDQFLHILKENSGLSAWAVILELLICQVDKAHLEFTVMDSIVDDLIVNKLYETCYLFLGVLPHLKTISPAKTRQLILNSINFIIDLENRKEHRIALKDRLVSLIGNDRFFKTYTDIIIDCISGRQFNAAVFGFALELNLQTKHLKMDEILSPYSDHIDKNPKMHLLSILRTGNISLDTVEQFIIKYGKKALLDVYLSNFGISWSSTEKAFSWPMRLLKTLKQKGEILAFEDILKAYKISKHDLETHFRILIKLDPSARHLHFPFFNSAREGTLVYPSFYNMAYVKYSKEVEQKTTLIPKNSE